ncbi:MAG: ABC transporter ATP-binding protein [Cryomorphaceae bacterium]|nr:ABC transporter ATP-binding protein [Cryomorphaceae bacterium]
MRSYKKLWPYAKPYSSSVALHIFFNLLAIVFALVSIGLVVPVLQIIFENTPKELAEPTWFVDRVKVWFYAQIQERVSETSQGGALFLVVVFVIVAFVFKNFFRYLAMYVIAPLRNGITRDLRNDLHKKVLALPLGYFSDRKKGDIISRLTSDLKEIEWAAMMTIELLFREPIMILASLGVLLYMNAKLTLFVLVMLPVASFIITRVGRSLKKSSKSAQEFMGELIARIDETVGGLRILKAFNAEDHKQKTFSQANNRYYQMMNRVLRRSDMASPLSEALGASIMAVVIWFGGQIVMSTPSFGAEQFIAYILFFYQIIPPAKSLSRASFHLQRADAASRRILEVLEAKNDIVDPETPVSPVAFERDIRFSKVVFGYGDGAVLHGIDLQIPAGKTVALVGLSGSGKTSIANLIPRFYDVDRGEITIDGVDIRQMKLKELRGLMGIVGQEAILFNDTVHANIALGKPNASRGEVEEAARVAHAYDFIAELPEGFDANIGDLGMKLSGGQRQRLSIARAILKNPPLLILDEATSALDTESERLVQDALNALMKDRTALVIAHRLSTVRFADLIVVLDQGRILEQGTHESLISAGGQYSKLWSLQGG